MILAYTFTQRHIITMSPHSLREFSECPITERQIVVFLFCVLVVFVPALGLGLPVPVGDVRAGAVGPVVHGGQGGGPGVQGVVLGVADEALLVRGLRVHVGNTWYTSWSARRRQGVLGGGPRVHGGQG